VAASWATAVPSEGFATRAQARRAVAGYLDYYNHQRRHSTCGMLAPAVYEQQQSAAHRERAA
jgi:transposase InsO family protein